MIRVKRLALALLAGAAALTQTRAFATPSWSEKAHTFKTAEGADIRATVLTINLNQANLRVLSVPFEMGSSPGSTETSVRIFAGARARDKKFRGKDWILVNGGFSSYRVDVPLGLLVVSGKVYSTLSKEMVRRTSPAAGLEFSKYRWSGVLCKRGPKGNWDIIPAAGYEPGMCEHALQAGPVPVEPDAKAAISENESKSEPRYLRTLVCLDGASSMKVVVTQDITHLRPLSLWTSKPENAGGLGCRVALNLSGDTSSGPALYTAATRSTKFLGDGTFPVPTVLFFEGK